MITMWTWCDKSSEKDQFNPAGKQEGGGLGERKEREASCQRLVRLDQRVHEEYMIGCEAREDLFVNVHSSFIGDSHTVGANQMPLNRWRDNQTVVHPPQWSTIQQ